MATYIVLFNPLSGKLKEAELQIQLNKHLPEDNLEFYDLTKIENLQSFFANIKTDSRILLAGGDGTLNRFINDTDNLELNSIYYYAAGNGNDFWSDIGRKLGDAPVCIDKYLKNLPVVKVNGKTYRFLNGVGYGIDGYCCEVGDKLKAKGKAVNYTSIAIKGLLFGYKPCTAYVTVDGVTKIFKKAWIAPTMNGRYYGGGMIPTPNQDRLNGKGLVSVCLMFGKGKIKTLITFPTIFKGEHINNKMVEVLSGREITVKFEKPCALQIDGETILNVSEYTVHGIATELQKPYAE